MEYLHTMVRVTDLEKSLEFYRDKLGLIETRRVENEKGRFTLVFLAAPGDVERAKATKTPLVELTWNWDPEVYTGGRNFGHLAYQCDDISGASLLNFYSLQALVRIKTADFRFTVGFFIH